jgi:ABC-2 type transport system ATP-binding protein
MVRQPDCHYAECVENPAAAERGPAAGPPAPADRREPPAAPVIRTDKLTKTYHGADVAAVDELVLDVRQGEIFGLLGPNGAGKTTTVGMLTTRVVPTSGRAFVGDVDVVARPALAKQLIGVVSQQNTLDRRLTVWENLYFHGLLFGVARAESRRISDRLLEEFRLAKWAKSSVYALSGGMAQRLMVARAIFHRPAVLFMDEPTAGLDPQSRLALWEILGELHAQGQTILLTTHYMEEAERLCERVAIMDHGRILALGSPDELTREVGADTIVSVRAEGDLGALAAALERGVDGVTRTRHTGDGVELHLRGTGASLTRIVGVAEDAGFDVADLSVAKPTLENVFIQLTGKDLRD